MREFSHLKFLDRIILPLFILIAARYLGVFVSDFLLPTQFKFSGSGDYLTLPFIQFSDSTSRFLANSFSWLLVATALVFYFGFVLFRVLHLHEDEVHPKHAKDLHKNKLEFLIISKLDAYHQTLVWLLLATVVLLFATRDFLIGQMLPIVFGLIFGITLSLVITAVINLATSGKSERDSVK